jgi:hypothetical protein
MNCPYCAERVHADAVVCKHCHRELFLIRPLMDKLAAATKRIETFEAEPSSEPSRAKRTVRSRRGYWLPTLTPLSALSLMFIGLILAHFVLIVEYNLPLAWLRTASILIPLAFGFAFEESSGRSLWVEFICGVAIAATAILTMSAIIGRLDHVPVLPSDRYEWREFAEYGASIAFGFFTGVIIRHTLIAMHSPAEIQNRLLQMAWTAAAKGRDGKIAGYDFKRFAPFVRTAAAVLSAIVSVSTGFKQFF